MNHSPRFRYIFIGAALLGGISLSVAYIAEYAFDLFPCFLCVYERIPYALSLLLGLLGWVKPKAFPETLILLLFCSFFMGSALSFYHVGVEHHVFSSPELCSGKAEALDAKTVQDLQTALNSTPIVRCDEVLFRFLGLSMTEYNFFLSLFVSGILGATLIKLWNKTHKRKNRHKHHVLF